MSGVIYSRSKKQRICATFARRRRDGMVKTSVRKRLNAEKAQRREEMFQRGCTPDGGPICDPGYPAWLLARGLDPVRYLLDFDYDVYASLPTWARQLGVTWMEIYEAQDRQVSG